MECKVAQQWLFRKLDDELSLREGMQLDSHLAECGSCARGLKLLSLPRSIGRAIPALEPSPYFYSRLKAHIESSGQSITIWQIILGLSKQALPAMATLTLALLSIFAYFQLQGTTPDIYQAYDSIFMPSDSEYRMVIADQEEITDESVIRAMSELESNSR